MNTVTGKIMMKQHANFIHCTNNCELVVLLENCLKDVPRSDQKHEKSCKQDLSSNISMDKHLLPKTVRTTTNVESDSFMDCHNENLSFSDPILSDTILSDTILSEEDYVLCSDEIEPATQTLSPAESLLLDLPIPSTIDKDKVAKSSMIEGDSLLCWEKLVEPFVCEVKTPLVTSGNSSVVDLDLTPPSSVASGRNLFEEDRSTSFEDSFALNFDVLPDKTAKDDVGKKTLTDTELCVEVVHFEPTLRQLQILHRRIKASGTPTYNNSREYSSRPKRSLKQFVPFMFQQAKYMKKQRKKKFFHSTPKVLNTSIKKKTNNTKTKDACTLQIDRKLEQNQLKIARKQKKAIESRQLKLALKQKEAFEKKQLKLALKQKKEALKDRNKFKNALDSINRRMCNQNSFWRMLPR